MNKNTKIARKLRNNMTDAEKYLWYVLKGENLGIKFRRQAQIGKYFVDFVCYPKKLVIEVDGGQHDESASDKARDNWLKGQGFTILRFWNNEVLNSRDSVVEEIQKYLR